MDSPEKREQLFLKKGNGLYSERTMYSFDVKNQIQSIGSCDICHMKNIAALKKLQKNEIITENDIEDDECSIVDDECSGCCDWNFESPNAHFIVPNVDYKALDFFVQNGYDVVDANGSYLHSKCIKLDFRKLKDIVVNVSLEYFKNKISDDDESNSYSFLEYQ